MSVINNRFNIFIGTYFKNIIHECEKRNELEPKENKQNLITHTILQSWKKLI